MQSFTSVKEQHFEEEIISGRYNIHKRDWSAEEERLERLKASRGDHRNTAEVDIITFRFYVPRDSWRMSWS